MTIKVIGDSIDSMKQLLVRNVPLAIVRKLKRRAAEHGVAMEEEHRRILIEALNTDGVTANRAFVAHLLSGEGKVADLPIRPRRVSDHRRVKF